MPSSQYSVLNLTSVDVTFALLKNLCVFQGKWQMSNRGVVKTGASLQGLQQICGREASDRD